MKAKSRSSSLMAIGILAATFSGWASAVTDFTLPTPLNNPNATYSLYPDATGNLRPAIMMNGIPIAFKYDDFWSYSAKLLEAMQTQSPNLIPTATFGQYNFSTGTGTIDINVSSVSQGATNLVGALTFQDPVALSSNQQVTGWQCSWGGLTQYCTNYGGNDAGYTSPAADQHGTTTVGNLLTYLHGINASWNIPVLFADYNQTGVGDSLWFSAKVEIFDSTGTSLKGSWQLDANTNNTWDQSSPTFNYGQISFQDTFANCAADPWSPLNGTGCAGVTANGDVYDKLSHNKGSGKADFMVFADTMDLSKYLSTDLFVVTADLGCIPRTTAPFPGTQTMGCNTGGGEEFGILGGVAPTRVPEPGSLALLGAGLGVLGWCGIRSRRQLLAAK